MKGGRQAKGKGKGGKRKGKSKISEKWAWKREPPKEGEKEEKVVNDTKYYWCPHHSLWTLTKHTEGNCDKLKEKRNETSNNKSSESRTKIPDSTSNKSTPPSLSFAAKIQDLMQE